MTVRPALIRFAAFAAVMLVLLAALYVVFAQIRISDTAAYHADFANVSGLREGEKVRIAGVEVGKVSAIRVVDTDTAVVDFYVESDQALTRGSRATVRYQNLVGDRYLELGQGPGDTTILRPGETIPRDQTAPSLDLDALLNGFRPLFKALDPGQVNKLSSSLVEVLQGQAGAVQSILTQTASLTSALADRDQLIGSVIDNLNSLLGTLVEHREPLSGSIDKLQQLTSGLAAQADPISQAVESINTASGTVADLLVETRGDLQGTLTQAGATASILAGSGALANTLDRLPDAYRKLARIGAYGNFFNLYICDITIKYNGPNGDPIYTPLLGQNTGRCTPNP